MACTQPPSGSALGKAVGHFPLAAALGRALAQGRARGPRPESVHTGFAKELIPGALSSGFAQGPCPRLCRGVLPGGLVQGPYPGGESKGLCHERAIAYSVRSLDESCLSWGRPAGGAETVGPRSVDLPTSRAPRDDFCFILPFPRTRLPFSCKNSWRIHIGHMLRHLHDPTHTHPRTTLGTPCIARGSPFPTARCPQETFRIPTRRSDIAVPPCRESDSLCLRAAPRSVLPPPGNGGFARFVGRAAVKGVPWVGNRRSSLPVVSKERIL